MSLASDQDGDDRLSPNARRMRALRDAVLAEWTSRVRADVPEAARLPQPILVNTFPTLYDDLTETISPDHERGTDGSGNSLAAEHGGERARLTDYNVRAVIAEYQVLRWAIVDVLAAHGIVLTPQEAMALHAGLDAAIRQAVNAFALAESALRERFVAALTHDLRNPLAAAHGAAELIGRSADTPRVRQLAERITTSLGRMDAMISQLLDAIVFQAGERLRLRLEPVDLLQLVAEICDQYAMLHGPRFVLRGTPVAGFWDRQALRRAIENLLGNAVKYGEPDTPITVTLATTNGRMALMVHNEGPPIPLEEEEGIFQVFRRAQAATGAEPGWGIGLPFVRSVAESHGGSVGVDSGPGRGTTFTIDLPLDAAPFQHAPTLDPIS